MEVTQEGMRGKLSQRQAFAWILNGCLRYLRRNLNDRGYFCCTFFLVTLALVSDRSIPEKQDGNQCSRSTPPPVHSV